MNYGRVGKKTKTTSHAVTDTIQEFGSEGDREEMVTEDERDVPYPGCKAGRATQQS